MKSVEFCYWLQGLFELQNPKTLNAKQTDLIRKHLALVFFHEIDPSYGDDSVQEVMNEMHSGTHLPQPGSSVSVPYDNKPTSEILFRC